MVELKFGIEFWCSVPAFLRSKSRLICEIEDHEREKGPEKLSWAEFGR